MDEKELKLIEDEIVSLKFAVYEILDKLEYLSDKISAAHKSASERVVERTVELEDGAKLKIWIEGARLVNAELLTE